MKNKDYGFRTPVRRSVNNVTGNKVGGTFSGGECKILNSRSLILDENTTFSFKLSQDAAIPLFSLSKGIAAIGGYFLSTNEINITLKIVDADKKQTVNKTFSLNSGNPSNNVYEKIGLDYEFNMNESDPNSFIELSVLFEVSQSTTIYYNCFSYGFIDFEPYIENGNLYKHYSNSKKHICVPEQFYFFNFYEFEGSHIGWPSIFKSCNRCQRFLPINHFNERIHIAFSNHCVAKAPCTHTNFYNYEILENETTENELHHFITTSALKIKDRFVISYYGHQLECKACKKFFVNASLNHLRTTTQHKEDALRRRAFERLIGLLTGDEWIYHKFRRLKGIELDKYIWEKFDKKCFNCGTSLSTSKEMDLDHTMPLVSLYPLGIDATCLCPTCNSKKHDNFPVNFYSPDKLQKLSEITGINYSILSSENSNQIIVKLLKEKIRWFYEEFIVFEEYTKMRDGKRVADSIIHSLQKAIDNSLTPFNLEEEYKLKMNGL